MRRTLIIPALLLSFLLTSCGIDGHEEGSGVLTTLPVDVEFFTGVSAETGYRVTITPDSSCAAEVTTDDNLAYLVDAYQDGAVLHLGLKPGADADVTTLRAAVRMPTLSSLILSSGASCSIAQGFDSDGGSTLTLSSGSRVEGTLSCGALSVVMSSGSVTTLRGSAPAASILASSGSVANMREYETGDARVIAGGGSTVYVCVTGRLDVTASGGSRVFYAGNPQLGEVNISGGSTLQRIN